MGEAWFMEVRLGLAHRVHIYIYMYICVYTYRILGPRFPRPRPESGFVAHLIADFSPNPKSKRQPVNTPTFLIVSITTLARK